MNEEKITIINCISCNEEIKITRGWNWQRDKKQKPISNLLLCPYCNRNATGVFIK